MPKHISSENGNISSANQRRELEATLKATRAAAIACLKRGQLREYMKLSNEAWQMSCDLLDMMRVEDN